jgi:hypothetical protein
METLPELKAYTDEMVRKAIQKLDYWGDVRLSYSSWRNFKNCPLKGVLALTYVVPGVRKPANVMNFRGQVVHQVFDMVLARAKKEPHVLLGPDAFVEAIPTAWQVVERQEDARAGVDWESGEQKVEIEKQLYDTMIRVYPLLRYDKDSDYYLLRDCYRYKFETEYKFKWRIEKGVYVTGKVDLRINTGDEIVLVDWKDGKSEYCEWQQLATYAIDQFLQPAEQRKKIRAGFLFTSENRWSWRDVNDRWDKLRSGIMDTVELIHGRQFEAKVNALCDWCDYQGFCATYAEQGGLKKAQRAELTALADGEQCEW